MGIRYNTFQQKEALVIQQITLLNYGLLDIGYGLSLAWGQGYKILSKR